jgi:hypothetical protein
MLRWLGLDSGHKTGYTEHGVNAAYDIFGHLLYVFMSMKLLPLIVSVSSYVYMHTCLDIDVCIGQLL